MREMFDLLDDNVARSLQIATVDVAVGRDEAGRGALLHLISAGPVTT